ncbi:hypothetical protein R6Q59_013980 [Mikania micrantha]
MNNCSSSLNSSGGIFPLFRCHWTVALSGRIGTSQMPKVLLIFSTNTSVFFEVTQPSTNGKLHAYMLRLFPTISGGGASDDASLSLHRYPLTLWGDRSSYLLLHSVIFCASPFLLGFAKSSFVLSFFDCLREGARVMWGYVNRILGQPSLIRESSMEKFPWSGIATHGMKRISNSGTSASVENKHKFGNIVIHPSLQRRIKHIAHATANTKSHQAPFRNMLFYGPPGTGKTLVAKEIARKSGLDYAMMTGGDVAPLGAQAVTKIHEIFD